MGIHRLLKRAGASDILAGGLAVFCLYFYGLFAGGSAATLRALVMFILMIGGRILGRSYDLPSALALAAILLLLDSPEYLFYSGFLLSFATVLGIGFMMPGIENIFQVKTRMGRALLPAISIWLTSAPWILYFYYELPVYGFLFNLLLLPMLPVVLISGAAAGLAAQWNLWAGHILMIPAQYILKLYGIACEGAARLPMGTLIIGQPKPWQMVIYYGMLLCVMGIAVRNKKILHRRLFLTLSLALAALWLLISPELFRAENMTITSLDVGQGDCHVIKSESQSIHIIDGGSSSKKNIGSNCLLPYLKSQGVRRISCVWISHTDEDHVSGIVELLKAIADHQTSMKVSCLALPDWKEQPEAYTELVKLGKKCNAKILYIKSGDIFGDGSLNIRVLSPKSGYDGEDINDGSEILEVTSENFRGLFTGDVGMEQEAYFLKELKDCDYLKVAHHGSKNSTSEAFLESVKPDVCIISCGKNNRYGHPHRELLDRLEGSGSGIYRTDQSGAIICCVENEKMKIQTFVKEKSRQTKD